MWSLKETKQDKTKRHRHGEQVGDCQVGVRGGTDGDGAKEGERCRLPAIE